MQNGNLIIVADNAPSAWYFNAMSVEGAALDASVTMMTEVEFLELKTINETNEYIIKEQPAVQKNRDVYNGSVVEWDSSSLSFYPYGYGCYCYNATMNTSV